MIIRKPYAFFIKMFKPIHLLMVVLVSYLLYLENKILSFFNEYINTSIDIVGDNLKERLVSNLLFIIPIILILLFIFISVVMMRKKKPILFYVVSIFSLIAVIVINIYAANTISTIEKMVISISSAKLIHDIVLIATIILIVLIIFLLIRGLGINFKKFDFDSDISKMNIDESDKEEIEININFDLNKSKTDRKRKIRNLKYIYSENRFLINISIIIVSVIIIFIVAFSIYKSSQINKEGNVYSVSGFNMGVDNSIILNTDYQGNEITKNYLVVLNVKMNSYINNYSLYLKDFSLKIKDMIFKPTNKYSNLLIDIGDSYNNNVLSQDYKNYLFIFEIPEKFINSSMYFSYSNLGENFDIKVYPKEKNFNEVNVTKQITEEISFSDTLGDIKFKIYDYEIKKQFLIQYNYCVKKDDCILSKEYLTSSIDTNFDKYILRLKLDYSNNSNLNLDNFYNFFEKFGEIYYYKNNEWLLQDSEFESIKSKKTNDKENVYIGINSNIYNSSNIKLVFNIRGSKYEYILEGES